jgi:hypothetical protein
MLAAMFCDHSFDETVASSAREMDLILQDSTFDFLFLEVIDLIPGKLGVGSTTTGSGLNRMKVQSQVTGVLMLHGVLTSASRKQPPSSRDSRLAALGRERKLSPARGPSGQVTRTSPNLNQNSIPSSVDIIPLMTHGHRT